MRIPVHVVEFDRPDWYQRANCRGVGPELFYPERGAATTDAVAVCRGCEVRADCLSLALQHHEIFGIWGGRSQHQLRAMRSRRAAS